MSDKNEHDMSSDDDFYDDVLEENFEFDDDNYDDVDLESDVSDFDDDNYDEFDEDWSEGEESASHPLAETKKKPAFSLGFNTIVILGAIVVGIFVVVSQVSKEKAAIEIENPPEVIVPTALNMEGAFSGPGSIDSGKSTADSAKADKSSKFQQKDGDGGFLFDVDVLEGANVIEDAPPMPSPIASEILPDIVEPQNKISDFLVEDDFKESGEAQVPRSPDVLEESDVVVNTTETNDVVPEVVTNAKEAEQAPKIEMPMREDTKGALDEVKVKDIAASAVPKGSEIEGVAEKLDSIIRRLDGMEAKIVEIEGNNNRRVKAIVADIETLKERKNASLVESRSVSRKAVKKPSTKKKAIKGVRKRSSTSKAVKIVWELRAAQPGKAWVSQRGKKNMRPVVVGDKLPSIGRIEAISHIHGRWVVRGSGGKITQ